MARQLNTELRIIECDILENGKVAENPPDRCYHCKRTIFSKLAETALADGYELLIDGTNASDPEGERPGMRALRDLEVLSPLRNNEGSGAPAVQRSRTFYLEQAGLCLFGDQSSFRSAHHRAIAAASRSGGVGAEGSGIF